MIDFLHLINLVIEKQEIFLDCIILYYGGNNDLLKKVQLINPYLRGELVEPYLIQGYLRVREYNKAYLN